MTTVNTSATTTAGASGADAAPQAARPWGSAVAGPATFSRVVASELIKLRTIRSTTWAMVIAVLSVVLLGAFTAVGVVVQDTPPDGALDASATDPTGGALTGATVALYAVVAFGAMAVGNEYATGSIRVSLAAVPRRARLVWGKAAAVAAVTFVVTLVASVATFFVAKAIVATDGITISLTTPGVARAVVGVALYLTVLAVLAVGTTWLLRSTAGSVAALLVVLLLVPSIAAFLPSGVADVVLPYLPSNAGSAILQTAPAGLLDPWVGFAVFCGYAVLLLTAAARVVQRRDA